MGDIPGALSEMNDVEIASDAPLTEALHTKIGANLNALIGAFLPVGSIIHSLLTEDEFQTEIGSENWILADGRDITGSAYTTLTGQTTAPDMRGKFLRGKNNGVSENSGDSQGERSLGTYQQSIMLEHSHSQSAHAHPITQRVGYVHTTTVPGVDPAGTINQVVLTPGYANNAAYTTNIPLTIEAFANVSGVAGTSEIDVQAIDIESAPRNICVNIFMRIN